MGSLCGADCLVRQAVTQSQQSEWLIRSEVTYWVVTPLNFLFKMLGKLNQTLKSQCFKSYTGDRHVCLFLFANLAAAIGKGETTCIKLVTVCNHTTRCHWNLQTGRLVHSNFGFLVSFSHLYIGFTFSVKFLENRLVQWDPFSQHVKVLAKKKHPHISSISTIMKWIVWN